MNALSPAQQEKQRFTAYIQRQQLFLRLSPIAIGALPFVDLSVGVAAAVGGALMAGYLQKKLHLKTEDTTFDNDYVNEDIDDCDFRRSTYFGQGMPFSRWRDLVDESVRETGEPTPQLKRRVLAQNMNKMTPFMLSDDLWTRHMGILAATGLGKTELIKAIAKQQIDKGGGLILFEAKSDKDLTGSIYRMMEEADRLDELDVVNFTYGEKFHSYNPLQSGGVRAALNVAMKVQASSKEEFWTDVARDSLSASILLFKLQPGKPAFCIKDLVAVLSDLSLFLELARNINPKDSPDHASGKEYISGYLDSWWDTQNGEWKINRYNELLRGVTSKLRAFCHSEYDRVVNVRSGEVDPKRVILEGRVLVISMSALADKDGVELFGRLFMADIARAIGEIQEEAIKPLSLCPLILDEYGSIAHEDHEALVQLARSAGVPVIPAMQGKGFLSKAGEDFANNFLGNCWHHIYSDVRDNETRQYAMELSGMITRRLATSSTSVGLSESHKSSNSGLVAQEAASAGTSSGTRDSKETLLQPEDFADLGKGDAIIVGKSGTWRVRLPLVEIEGHIPTWEEMTVCRRKKPVVLESNAWKRYSEKVKERLSV